MLIYPGEIPLKKSRYEDPTGVITL